MLTICVYLLLFVSCLFNQGYFFLQVCLDVFLLYVYIILTELNTVSGVYFGVFFLFKHTFQIQESLLNGLLAQP